jgi:hypothetical protein
MNAIQHSVNNIKYVVPRPILDKVFLPYNAFGRIYTSKNIDELIINNVIKARVLVDCNLIGGTSAVIPLEGLPYEKPDNISTAVRIPKDRTEGKSINSVLNVSFINPLAVSSLQSANRACGSTAVNAVSQALAQSFDTIPIVSTSRVQLIAENTILIRDNVILSSNCFLRCVLANDDELNNIPLRAYRHFSNLVEYAVKSYIYNEFIIELDQGVLQGGFNIGAFKNIIESYSDAEQNYKDYLREKWEVVSAMSDSQNYERFIGLIVGSNR